MSQLENKDMPQFQRSHGRIEASLRQRLAFILVALLVFGGGIWGVPEFARQLISAPNASSAAAGTCPAGAAAEGCEQFIAEPVTGRRPGQRKQSAGSRGFAPDQIIARVAGVEFRGVPLDFPRIDRRLWPVL